MKRAGKKLSFQSIPRRNPTIIQQSGEAGFKGFSEEDMTS
jgi:hypothetical protein